MLKARPILASLSFGFGTAQITFTAGAVGTLHLDCLVISKAGIPAHGSAATTVTP